MRKLIITVTKTKCDNANITTGYQINAGSRLQAGSPIQATNDITNISHGSVATHMTYGGIFS